MKPITASHLLSISCGMLVYADSLHLDGTAGEPGTLISAEVRLANERRIVGMQFDLKIPASQAEAGGAMTLEGMEHHRLNTRVAGNRLKVVVHSTTNAELPSGSVLSIPLSLSSRSPQGGPAVSIENLIFTNAAGQAISGSVFYHPLELWRQQRFTEEQRENPDIIGDLKDPDGDGFTNLAEFLYATDPLVKNPADTVRQSVGRSASGPFIFSFDYPKARGSDGVELWIETSPDMVRWTRQPAQATEVGGDSATALMRLVMESDPATAPKRFFRISTARSATATPLSGTASNVTYETWIAGRLSPAEQGNAAISGEQADPDGDGMANLMEYFFGTDPKVASTSSLPIVGLMVDAGLKTAVLRYKASLPASDASLLLEAATDPMVWTDVSPAMTNAGSASASLVEMVSETGGPTQSPQFFRFLVIKEP